MAHGSDSRTEMDHFWFLPCEASLVAPVACTGTVSIYLPLRHSTYCVVDRENIAGHDSKR